MSRYAYHHGYFDGYEREFRGFGLVEQWDTEEHREDTVFPTVDDTNWDHSSWSPPVHTRSWFHTGAFLQARSVSRQYAHEYWIEPALRPEARAADRRAMELPDSVITSDTPMSAFELQEAYRALKGLALRVEVYSDDGSPLAANPYSIAETNYTVERRQRIGPNKHAVFYAHPRETLTFHYERQPDDPRVTHEVTLETDPFGNTKRAVSIGYPRRAGYAEPEPALSAQFRGMLAYDQTRLHIVATEHGYTNDLADPAKTPDVHRTPMPSQTTTWEWTGLAPTPKGTAITDLFSFGELDAAWSSVSDLAFENIPRSDVDGSGQVAAAPTRRMVNQARTLYRKDDLTGLCGPDQLESLALPGDTFTLALTPALVGRVFGTRVPDAMLQGDGGYVHFPPPDVPAPAADANWWIPTGRVFYSPGDTDTPVQELAEARAHFYLPRRAVAPFGGIGRGLVRVRPARRIDRGCRRQHADGDRTTIRVLQPAQITDANGNRSAVAFDALGLVVGTAVMGKTSESLGDSLAGFVADLDDATVQAQLADPLANPGAVLGSATTRLIYDLFAYDRTRNDPQPSPGVVYMLARETHVSDLAGGQTRYQHALSYSDGFGREIQKKVLAEPGPIVPNGPVVTPRWIATGWTIFNNKGKPVRTYEPFFTATPRFEFANTVGVSTVMLYDSADRVVATVRPNQTWTKVVFDAWRQDSWDVNDTRADRRSADGRRRRRSVHAPARHRARRVDIVARPADRRGARRGRAGGGEEHRAPRRDPGGRARRFARPDVPGDRRQRQGRPLPDAHGERRRDQAARDLRRAGPARLRVLLARTGRGRRLPVRRRARSRRQRALSLRHGRRRAARAFGCDRQADPRVGCARPRVRAPLRSTAPPDTPLRHGERDDDPARAHDLRRGHGESEPVRPAVPPVRPGRPRQQRRVRLQGQPRREHAPARGRVPQRGRLDGAREPDGSRGARCGRQAQAGRRRPVLRDEHV